MFDGRDLGVYPTAVHVELAQMILDNVVPPGEAKPAPSRDAMVRQWYVATATWMQLHEDHDTHHLDYARSLFPDDPDVLFLAGTQHATYATPSIQSAVRAATLPGGLSMDVDSDRGELRRAEGFLRKAVALRPEMAEARLRFGRVLGLLGRHEEAAAELREAKARVTEDPQRYYAALFLGCEEEALGRFDAARDAYAAANALFPDAQSPLIALSQLARRRGDRAGALAPIRQLFELPHEALEREDPWWSYHIAQARNADALLEALRAPFRREQF
jgi:tetratricopeptide (TPR) repeat protein